MATEQVAAQFIQCINYIVRNARNDQLLPGSPCFDDTPVLPPPSIPSTLSSMCKSASQADLGRMHLTLHATRPTSYGASRLVAVMSTWSVKSRRTPSPHC